MKKNKIRAAIEAADPRQARETAAAGRYPENP